MTFNEANELLRKDAQDKDAHNAFSVVTQNNCCDSCVRCSVCLMCRCIDDHGGTVEKCNFYVSVKNDIRRSEENR